LSGDLDILRLNASTLFTLDDRGMLFSENEPGETRPPTLFISGSEAGNLVLLRSNLSDELARDVRELVGSAPPWFDPSRRPRCLDELIAMIPGQTQVNVSPVGLIHELPKDLGQSVEATFIASETPEGDQLLNRLRRDEMPPALTAAAFASVDDFWAPWCVALAGEEIAAIAFAARLGPSGAECGVYTFPDFRGRGLAAAVTVAWSRLPALGDRLLFYSTTVDNSPSIAVARRLGLRRSGVNLRLH
jgi:hypothetical protein